MEAKIKVKVKNVYGENKVYPDCDKSRFFCELAKTKTMPRWMLQRIAKEGYYIEQTVGELLAY